MSVNVNLRIKQLTDYAVRKKLICEEDRAYVVNGLLSALGLQEYTEETYEGEPALEEILSDLCAYADKD